MQRLTAGPYGAIAWQAGCDLWLDGGHNPHGARAVAGTLERLARDGRPVALVAATLANKDAAGFFAAFAHLAPKIFATTFDADSAASAEQTASAARGAGLTVEVCPDLPDAIRRACNRKARRMC